MNPKRFRRTMSLEGLLTLFVGGLLSLGFAQSLLGCAGKEDASQETQSKTAAPQAAGSDTAAFRAASSLPDTLARTGALMDFVAKYPESPFRAGAYGRLYALKEAKDPEQASAFVRERLQAEKQPEARGRLYQCLHQYAKEHAPAEEATVIQMVLTDRTPSADVYNSIAWDLAERAERLDDAIQLAGIAVEKAKDDLMKGLCLDTQGYAYHQKGDFTKAVELFEQAKALVPKADSEEIDTHLAAAYDAAGMKAKARDLYLELLVSQEAPEMRHRFEALSHELDGSAEAANRTLSERRKANAKPAQDFALKNYDGQEVKLSDFAGKVILLNFWHPT